MSKVEFIMEARRGLRSASADEGFRTGQRIAATACWREHAFQDDNVSGSVRHRSLRALLGTSDGTTHHVLDGDTPDSPVRYTHSSRHLRIAVPPIMAQTLIAPALPRFLTQHREISVELVANANTESNRYDATLCVLPAETDLQPSARRLCVMREVLCASTEVLSVHGVPSVPQDLSPAWCIAVLDERTGSSEWSFRKDSHKVTLAPAAPLTFSDPQTAAAAAVRGGGFIRVPALAVEAQVAAGLLTPLLLDWSEPHLAIWIKYAGTPTPQLERFAEFVSALLPSSEAPVS